MINSILNIFREQARQHNSIQAFYYNRNYEIGNGNETHPLLWLEDPIWGRNQDNLFVNTVNFSVLFIPKTEQDIATFQNLAFSIGLNIIERIKKDTSVTVRILPTWSYVTLREYYDNNSCGCRFTVDFNQLNMQNLCLINEQFDEAGTLRENKHLPNLDLSPNNSREIFVNKLPVFDLKTMK